MANNIITVRFKSSSSGYASALLGEDAGWVGGLIAPRFPTSADVLYALARQNDRIQTRTASGVDGNGSPFTPYSTKRAYIYYPVSQARTAKGVIRNRDRVHRLLGGKGERVGKGIKFPSYAAFKAAFGSSVVNLMSVDPPNMLSQVEMRMDGNSVSISGSSLTSPASGNYTLGIYGQKGMLAATHNQGRGRMPQREFFVISASDAEDILEDIKTRIQERQR